MSKQTTKNVTRRRVLGAAAGAAGAALVGGSPAIAQTPNPRCLKGKRVLVAIGEFCEGLETYYMTFRLMEEAVVPVVAAPRVKRVQLVVHDEDPRYTNYTETPGYCIQSEVSYKDVDPADYDGILIPGGRGPEQIRQDRNVLDLVGYFYDKNLPLGAICHGPQVIYAARSVKGRRMTAYEGIRADVELGGAVYVDEPVVVDRALVTSRTWSDLPYMMPKFLEVLAANS